jgi:hypothetical protein
MVHMPLTKTKQKVATTSVADHVDGTTKLSAQTSTSKYIKRSFKQMRRWQVKTSELAHALIPYRTRTIGFATIKPQ